jgi:hypothetical protein
VVIIVFLSLELRLGKAVHRYLAQIKASLDYDEIPGLVRSGCSSRIGRKQPCSQTSTA